MSALGTVRDASQSPDPAGAGSQAPASLRADVPQGTPDSGAPAGTEEVLLVVAERETVAQDVVAVTLAAPDGAALPAWEPGAHVDLLLAPGLRRAYSLCGGPDDPCRWRIAVRRAQGGRGGSELAHLLLRAGAFIVARGPRNHFPLAPAERYLFIAGGIGITALLPMVHAVQQVGLPWELHYGGRSRQSMPFLQELTALGPRVRLHPSAETGRIDLDAVLGEPRPGTAVYCCGPEPMLSAVRQCCASWPPGTLHTEHFAAPPPAAALPAAEPHDQPFEVVLARSARTILVQPGQSIAAAVEEAGVPVLYACGEGVCGTCATTVLDGMVEHRDCVLDEAERALGRTALICVSRSRTPTLTLDL